MYSVLLDFSSLWGPLVMPLIETKSARPQMGQDGPGVFVNIVGADPTMGMFLFIHCMIGLI